MGQTKVTIELPDPAAQAKAAAPSDETKLVGRRLGEFVIRERLAEGGFGEIFLAEQERLGRTVVIKVLRRQLVEDLRNTQRFLREARLAANLDHPYAAHIYAFGVEPDGMMWLAMERVRGITLRDYLKTHGRVPLARFVPFLERLCEVIHTAHEQGIVHRDITPRNIMVLSRAGQLLPKLLDFGIAKTFEAAHLDAEGDGESTSELSPAPTPTPEGRASATPSTASAPPQTETQELTSRGTMLGSPTYMAPEQWRGAATARSDLYSLGIVTFQALAGQAPFRGRGEAALLFAHTAEPLPTLGGGFPPGLDTVLAKATAKKEEDRFTSAIEFAHAFRAACGTVDEPSALPRLDDSIREAVLVEGPQPLADVVAALDAARTLDQVAVAIRQLRWVLAHYLGVLALMSRVRVGSGSRSYAPHTRELLVKLRRRGLDGAEWLDLAQALCEPFGRTREAHPLPELVTFFLEPDRLEPAGHIAPLRAQLERERAQAQLQGERAQPSAAEVSPSLLHSELRELSLVLERMTGLFGYMLSRVRDERGERWTGIRRLHRPAFIPTGELPEEGAVFLTSPEGAVVLKLSPLVQALSPSPGHPEELFLLDNPGRHGARLTAMPLGFERHDRDVWTWFDAKLGATSDARLSGSSEPEVAPYLGLAAFTTENAENFFGREREAEAVGNRLRVQPLIAIVGPSGVGKSSFVQAGLIPLLPPGWRAVTLRPGRSPLTWLAGRLRTELGSLGQDLDAAGLREDPGRLHATLQRAASALGTTFVLVVDQFEELLTLCRDAGEREAFAEALARAAASAEGPVRVVLTLRDDFLIRAQQLPALHNRLGEGIQLLGTPPRHELVRLLVQPARNAGYEFETPELPQQMVDTVAELPGALALLSFTASKLWELRDRQLKRLTARAYHALGGVAGALAHHAEDTLAWTPERDQQLVREAFRHLVTADRTRAVLTRAELREILGRPDEADSVLERLIAARLLVASEGSGGEDRVEVIHEALLTSWPRLVEWQREDAENARMRDQLRAAARQWHERGRPRGLLWRDEALMEYRVWRARSPGSVTAVESDFAAASLRDEARGKRLRTGALAAVVLSLSVGVLSLAKVNLEAKARLLRLYQEQGRSALLAGDPLRALTYLLEVWDAGQRSEPLGFMLARAHRALRGELLSIHAAPNELHYGLFSPDGQQLLTAGAESVARLWDARTGRQLATLEGHERDISSAQFSADGARVVTTSMDRTAKLWDARTGKPLLTVGGEGGEMFRAALSPDGARLLTTSADGKGRLWDTRTGALLHTLTGGSEVMFMAAFSPDGRRVATGGGDALARVWDVASGALVATLTGHSGEIWRGSFSPDGTRVAAIADKSAKVWNASTGALLASFDQHESDITEIVFRPDGQELATSSADGAVKLWSPTTGKVRLTLRGRAPVTSTAFSPDGERIVACDNDGNLHSWETQSGVSLWTYVGHTVAIGRCTFSSDGRRLVTRDSGGFTRVWDASLQAPSSILRTFAREGFHTEPTWARFTPDGSAVLAINYDQSVVRWNPAGGKIDARFEQVRVTAQGLHRPTFAEPSPDGLSIAIATGRPDPRHEVELRSAKDFSLQARLVGHHDYVDFATFDPTGAWVLTASWDRTGILWERATGRPVHTLRHAEPVHAAAFSLDGTRVATASEDRTAKVWDAKTGRELVMLSGHLHTVNWVDFSPDGRRVVTASEDTTAKIWDAKTGAVIASLEGHEQPVTSARFSPDGRLVATASADGTGRIWDAESGDQLDIVARHGGGLVSAAWSPDGAQLVTAGRDGLVQTWEIAHTPPDAQQLETLRRCRLPFRLRGEKLMQVVPDASCRPDGEFLPNR